jgi:hypothetical protein
VSGDEFDALAWVDAELVGLLGADSPENHARRRALRSIRDLLATGQYARQVVEQLDVLCPCHHGNPEEDEDGPQQDCPIHGDGLSFVALFQWQAAVASTAHAVIAEAPYPYERDALERLRVLLTAGPWAGHQTDAAVAAVVDATNERPF